MTIFGASSLHPKFPFPAAVVERKVGPLYNHIDTVVRPALRNYSAAEAAFTAAQNDGAGVDEARNQVMLTARQAANELHHLADVVFNNPPLRTSFADLGAVRATVHCPR
jgi:hypothetical protein